MINFSPFYEMFEKLFGLFDNQFSIVFQSFFNGGGYNSMGWILLLVPLLFLSIFYFLWKYPYAKFFHWALFLVIIGLIVGVLTFNSVSLTLADFLVDSNPLVGEFTSGLVLSYAILNACLSLLISFIYSLVMRRWSKIQMHLPF